MVSASTQPRRLNASIRDVASVAGVSAQTVSRVVNGVGSVRPETELKVRNAMAKLGYAPNMAARALRSGKFGTIGVLAHRFDRTGESMTVAAIVAAAQEYSYSVTLLSVKEPDDANICQAAAELANQAIDGLIIIRAETSTPTQLTLPSGMPVAVSDSRLIGYHPSVAADQAPGTTQAVEHLLGLGHRQVHHIAGPATSDPAAVRTAVWSAALEKAGIEPPQPWVGDWSAASGYRLGAQVLATPDVTAVFCSNDEMALGLVRYLAEHGLRVPADISVIGFDDIPLDAYMSPPLTTIHQNWNALGRELVSMIMTQFHSKHALPSGHRVLIPTSLIVRGSTAPPRIP